MLAKRILAAVAISGSIAGGGLALAGPAAAGASTSAGTRVTGVQAPAGTRVTEVSAPAGTRVTGVAPAGTRVTAVSPAWTTRHIAYYQTEAQCDVEGIGGEIMDRWTTFECIPTTGGWSDLWAWYE